ncbi:MAG: AAA family ATPase [Clostridia bacterium]|nr:AAA family ATPase [Clostridia bacterium]
MKNPSIVGRKAERAYLDECLAQSAAQLIVIYGRRRVGKTYLVNEYFDNEFAFKVTGAFDEDKAFQIQTFVDELSRRTGQQYSADVSWRQVFAWLREYLEQLPQDRKHVLFFDEMPWLNSKDASFLTVFEWFWNDWASTRKNLVFIVCGSATAWMIEHFEKSKGGLFNRQTCRLYLRPFSLHETEQFLRKKGINWSRYQIAECYMIMGGIPYYLNLLSNRLSYPENIDRLFFRHHGLLWDEFEHLYRTLFSNSGIHIKVAQALSGKTGGMTRSELSAKTGITDNGNLTRILNNLIASDFVRVSRFYGKKIKDAKYQLSDYYTAFYFRFLQDRYGQDEHFWMHANDHPARRAWAGLTFEQLCKDHISQIKQKLGISGVLTEESVWFSLGDPTLNIPGAQIDLVITRRDKVIHLCEMKFSINEFTIDKDYDAVLRNKLDAFQRSVCAKDTLLLTMVTTYGVRQNMYSGIVQSQVLLDDLFLPAGM